MGHVGAALAVDPSVLFFNPGLAATDVEGISFGLNAIVGRVSYAEPAPGTYTAQTSRGISTPFSIYANKVFRRDEDLRIGVGVGLYTPFGSRVQYDDNWKGQFMLREINLRTFFIQPTVSISYREKLGFGFGLVMAPGSVSLRKAIPAQFSNGEYGEASLSGSGMGYGFNVGAYWTPSSDIRIGISHRSSVGFKSDEGTAEFSVPKAVEEFFPTTTFAATIRLPSTTTLGMMYKLSRRFHLAADINYVGWSSYDTLGFDFSENTNKLDDQASPREYKNAMIFRLGGHYLFSKRMLIRAGAYLDLTPVQDGYLTPETPDAHKLGLSAGTSIIAANNIMLDAAFLWVEGFKRTGSNTEMNFHGTFKARAFIPAFGLTVLFR